MASNTDPPIASTYFPGYATLYSECMELSFTKLKPGAGSIEVEPTGNYVWDPATGVWLGAAQTMKVDASAEINVKGRVIYGYNWMLKRTATNPGVLKEGWWRITFYNTCPAVPLDFTPSTATFDPTAAEPPDDGESPGPSTYPRTPVVDTENELVHIDVYIQASTTGGKGGGGRRP